MKIVYDTPFVKVITLRGRSVVCASVGGNTGYSGSDIIAGDIIIDED